MEAMGDSCDGVRDVWGVGGDSGLTSVVETGPGAARAGAARAGAAWLGPLGWEGGGEKGASTLG